MVFTNYVDFRERVVTLLDGDDSADSGIATSTVDMLIALGESRVYTGDDSGPGLRATSMETALAQPVVSNAAALPADFLALKEAYFSGERPVEIVGLDRLSALESANVGPFGYGVPRYAAQAGDTLRFWPEAGGTLLGTYWKRPAAMADVAVWADNTTVTRYPECFIYAALAEAAPFIGDDKRVPMWEGKFRSWLNSAIRTEKMRVFDGSPLRIRAR